MKVGGGKTQAVLEQVLEAVQDPDLPDIRTVLFLCPRTALLAVGTEAIALGWMPVYLYPHRSTPVPDEIATLAASGAVRVVQATANEAAEPVAGALNITYQDAVRDVGESWALHACASLALVVDEFHLVTDRSTLRTQRIFYLARAAALVFLMSGTPVVSEKHMRGLKDWVAMCSRHPVTHRNFFAGFCAGSIEQMDTGNTVLFHHEVGQLTPDEAAANVLAMPPRMGGELPIGQSVPWDRLHRIGVTATERMLAVRAAAMVERGCGLALPGVRALEERSLRREAALLERAATTTPGGQIVASTGLFDLLGKKLCQRPFVIVETARSVGAVMAHLRRLGIPAGRVMGICRRERALLGVSSPEDVEYVGRCVFSCNPQYTEEALFGGALGKRPPLMLVGPRTAECGYNATAATCILQGVNHGSQAGRDQLVGRIDRLTPDGCRRVKTVTTVYPEGSLQQYGYVHQETGRAYSVSVMSAADRRGL